MMQLPADRLLIWIARSHLILTLFMERICVPPLSSQCLLGLGSSVGSSVTPRNSHGSWGFGS